MVYNLHVGEDVKMTGEERANPQLLEKGCWKEFIDHQNKSVYLTKQVYGKLAKNIPISIYL